MFPDFNPSDKPEFFGNHFIIGLSGTKLSNTDKLLLSKLKPAGILLLARNFNQKAPYADWLSELRDLLSETARYAERDKLIVSLDHEGGRVMRTPPPLTKFPEAIHFGQYAAAIGKAHGIEIRSLGVNVSWAPVADVHSNPANPIIGKRAFGKTTSQVIDQILPYTTALMAEGVLGCAKHYPGHGDTSTDSHLELPVLKLDEAQLLQRELPPFKALVDINIPFIMTAHISYPQIDSIYPATLSEKILKGILRDRWSYKGIIVSDDLDMKAVSLAFNTTETVGQAFKAGCDMYIVARQPNPDSDRPLVLADQMLRALRARQINEDLLHNSYQRIKDLFDNRLKNHTATMLSEETLEQHANLNREIQP